MKHERITFKCDFYDDVSSKIRVRELLGASYFVLPAVMMVEGAYYPSIQSCSDRLALYFSSDELKRSINTWNGRGISLMHPEENSSFNVPDVFDNHWLGFVFNANFEDDKKRLVADLWISNDRGKDLVANIQENKQVDLSIGACGELIESGGVSNGVTYTRQFVNIVGDHLAVLPDVSGACSWADGCGIRAHEYGLPQEIDKGVIMAKTVVQSILSKARKPAYTGVEESAWGSISKTFDSYIKGYIKHNGDSDEKASSVASASRKVKEWIASKTLLGDVSADTTRGLIFFPVVNPRTDKLNRGALMAVLSGRGQQADISEAAKESAMAKARSLLESEFKGTTEAAAQDMEPEKVTEPIPNEGEKMSKEVECKSVEGNKVPLETFIAGAPEEYKKFLLDAVVSTKARRDDTMKEILDFKDVSFCSKFLEETGTSDLDTIVSATRLVNRYKEELADAKVVVDNEAKVGTKGNGVVDFSVNGSSASSEKERYMPIRKIDFSA